MLTAVLCYAQPLNNRTYTAYQYFFKLSLSVTPIQILPVNKRLGNLGQIQFIAKSSSIYTNSVCVMSTRPFGEVGRKPPLQLSSRTHFAKIEDEKVISKN